METFEYFTTTFETNTEQTAVPISDDIPPTSVYPKYSVYTLIPQLNEYGRKGWELISIEPVQIGKKGDLRYCDTAGGQWTYSYFATFKRRTSTA